MKFIGHHPACESYIGHITNIKNRTYCIGCPGLSFGCLISIVFTFIYLMIKSDLSIALFELLVLIGLLIVLFTFLETILFCRNRIQSKVFFSNY